MMRRRWWFGFYANMFFFAASRFSHFISFTSNNRERTRNLSLCSSSALDLCLCSWNLWLEWCESFANFFFSVPAGYASVFLPFFFCASAHYQSPLSRNVFKSRDALTASPLRNAVFPLCLALRRFVCVFFTFCRNYLDREKCLQFVYLRYLFCCCLLSGWFRRVSNKGVNGTGRDNVCIRPRDNYRHFWAELRRGWWILIL